MILLEFIVHIGPGEDDKFTVICPDDACIFELKSRIGKIILHDPKNIDLRCFNSEHSDFNNDSSVLNEIGIKGYEHFLVYIRYTPPVFTQRETMI